MSQHSIRHGSYTINFLLERNIRKTFTINVLPDLSIVVKAPENLEMEKISNKVKERIPWIIKQQEHFKKFLPREPPRKYCSGETHRYLGRQYRLKIISSDKNNVKLKGRFFLIHSKRKQDPSYNKQLLENWYKKHAKRHFEQYISQCYKKLRKYGGKFPNLEIRNMQKRWGSSDPNKGLIRLNIDLIKAPVHCIEYVIMHEMIHLLYPYHDKQFYNLLSLVMPDWEERKTRLEMVII